MSFVRTLGRIALIAAAALLFMRLSAGYAHSIRPPRFAGPILIGPHRPAAPDVSAVPKFIGEGILIALVTFAGRVVFHLRLTG